MAQTPLEQETDIGLMLRVRCGDVAAFGELADRYRPPLRRFFASVLADPSLADDGVQETFIRLWMLRDRYEPTGRFSAYLYTIARHYWWNQRRKFRATAGEEALEDAVRFAGPWTAEPEAVLLEHARSARVKRAVQALPEHYRVVVDLCQLQGLPYAHAASQLGLPVGTVKSRMAKALVLLRRALVPEEGDEHGI